MPTGWNILLATVEDSLRLLNRDGVRVIGYADDIYSLARCMHEEILRGLVQRALKRAVGWCAEESLRLQAVMRSARKLKRPFDIVRKP